MLIALFGGFAFPEKTFADNTVTVAQILQHTSPIFDEKLSALQNELTLFASSHGGTNSQEYKDYAVMKNAELAITRSARTTFEQTLTAQTPGRTPQQLYGDALIAASTVLADGITSNVQLQKEEAAAYINNFRTELTTEAVSQQRIRAITTGQAIDQTAQDNARKTIGSASPSVASNQDGNCKFNNFTISSCITEGMTWFVKSVLLEFVGFFLWASANLLNYAMYHGVFKFKDFAPDGIYAIWLVVRQIVSLFVFFAGLFIGFMAIIGKSEEFKKYIAFLVVFGLFVNFSYPVVRVFVDISNVVSLQIYQTTMGGGILADNATDSAGARIMTKMGLQGLVMSATAAKTGGVGTKFTDTITSLPGALAAVAFVGLAAYVLFMAAFLLIVRTALLVCIIIASPILLVDTVVPALGEKAQWLRGMFISQLFVAPVFTIMLALTLKFLDIFSTTAGNPLNGAGNTLNSAASGGGVVVFFNLIMMLTMLFIMLKVTKAVAGGVGETVTKWAGKAGGLGVGVTAGMSMAGLGFAGRNTIGRAGEYLGQQGGIIGDLGRKMAGGKYDLRNLSTVQSLAQTAGISGMGRGVDKSRKEAETARNEENAKIAGGMDDEEERNQFLKRKFGAGSKELRNFAKEDDELLKSYINADDEKRKDMMDDPKNQRFTQRFDRLKNGDTSGMSDKIKTALDDKLAKDRAKEVRNTDRIANYLTSDQATRDSMYNSALAANDKKLLDQLTVMNGLVNQQFGTLTQASVAALGDSALQAKVLANDSARAASQMAQQNQAATQQAQVAAQQAIQQAQASAAQTQAQAAQDTNKALASLAQAQNDLAQQLKTLVTS